MKQTAVEWLVDKLIKAEFINNPDELIDQAKEMEKQQIMDAFEQQIIQWVPELLEDGTLKVSNVIKCSEQYYNEEYGGGK